MKNVRFWDSVSTWDPNEERSKSSYVKITLKPFQAINHYGGGQDEEGHTYWQVTYTYDAERGVIHLEQCSEFQCCDGRGRRYHHMVCPVEELEGNGYGGTLSPSWECYEESQRDHRAEAMGY